MAETRTAAHRSKSLEMRLPARWVLTTGNQLPPFRNIDLGCRAGYLRDISPHQRKPLARKILLADDSVTAQNMGRKILADAGYEVITVNNGSAALKKIAEAKPDLIVLDVYMPGYSGLEVCQRVKENSETSRIPILLTVGKLEPFKPDEAKRVHAEGFIVKPFEASELLSALTKLEDKIVPRADTSKPGRFARAIAAVEEGRYDNTVAIDEDTSWKERIAFPSKKKGKTPEPEGNDDPSIYNPVNRDLRTVLDYRPNHVPPTPAPKSVDLGALTPEGLPKDVTPEEIAALAAAAAQVKTIVEDRSGAAVNSAAHPMQPETPASGVQPPPEAQIEGKNGKASVKDTEAPAKTEAAPAHQTVEPEQTPVAAEPVSTEPPPAAPAAPTFAAQESDQKNAGETAPVAEPWTEAALSAAQSRIESQATAVQGSEASAAGSTQGAGSDEAAQPGDSEPVTMAAAAAAGYSGTASRWTAVSVPLSPEESGIVLEDEMRRLYSAFVGASTRDREPAKTSALAPAQPPEPVLAAEAAGPGVDVASLVAEASATTIATESAEPTSASISAPATTTPVVKEFEAVSVRASQAVAVAPAEPVVAPVSTIESVFVPEAVPTVAPELAIEMSVTPPAAEQEPVPAVVAEPAAAVEESVKAPESVSEVVPAEASEQQPAPEMSVSADPDPTIVFETPQGHEPARTVENAASSVSESPVSSATPETAAAAEPIRGGNADTAKKESEIAATTAAAWASWRRIRESGDPKAPAQPSPAPAKEPAAQPTAKEEAAMAVAAGAETAPESSDSAEESPEIANIVDSVLADLRPKIVEEISRKLKKKK